MKSALLLLLLTAAVVVGGVYWYSSSQQPATATEINDTSDAPIVPVRVEPVCREPIEERLITYGTVVAALGKSVTISEPFEVRVRRVFVTAGQSVDAGASLVEIEPSPDTQLKLDQARSELKAAKESEQLVQESFNMKLSTRQELTTAQQRLQDAQAALQSMLDRGMDKARAIKADSPGVVMQITAQAGQIVAAGSPLMEIVGENQINVRLGIEAEDIGYVHVSQRVRIVPVQNGGGRAADAWVALITQQVNPQTRLIDVYATPASASKLMLNEYVRGELLITAEESLVVPRAAVLPEEDHRILYTVANGRAVKHEVKIGVENDQKLQILGSDLQSGQLVVVSGNSELSDGMAVRVEPSS